jgi:subtilisin family serine protease
MPRRLQTIAARLTLGVAASLALLAIALFFLTFDDSSRPQAQSRPAPFRVAQPYAETRGNESSARQREFDGEVRRDVAATAAGADPGASPAMVPDESFEAGELLVADPPLPFWAEAEHLGLRPAETMALRHLGLAVHRLRTADGSDAGVALARLRQRFADLPIDYNHHYRMAQGREFPASYARALIGWTDLPADCGKGVHLGIIDAAVHATHPALRDAPLEYRSFHRRDRAPGPADHGTAIAALLVGVPAAGEGWGGLLPGARLSAANIFEFAPEANTVVATAQALLQAIDWMTERRVHAVNVSLAGPDNRVVRTAVERATSRALLLVAAAGNAGAAGKPAYPAAYDDALAITAVAADRTIYSHATRGSYVDFAAPGVRVWTAVPEGGRYQSGTSFATPYVTALVGLAVAQGMDADIPSARDFLRREVIDLGAPGHDNIFGWGLVKRKPSCSLKTGDAGLRRLGLIG